MKLRSAPPVIRLARVLAWLAVGAALNIAVAWAMMLTSGTYLRMQERATVTTPGWSGEWPADWRAAWVVEHGYELGVVVTARQEEPLFIPGLHSMAHRWQAAWCFGLPLQSLGYLERSEGILPTGGRQIAVTDWIDRGIGDIRTVRGDIRPMPIRSLWPGFALNTLFYAGIAWGLWQLPLALRRRKRNKKGLCVRCGYDLKGIAAGAACPECGDVAVRAG